ncbi:TVP38/TMEM64 family protein [Salisediminibacterium halotolerans]|uniref:TVP38/TMEM64 family protein n=1 Tax=Salisediminibacterium halotolerans TaxID=517425 RepID=UPI000EB391EF|nr:TVP38/TMEM64 family protein [Salisediminibacterium halotolerans]RLJ75663.1 putative membrane protein YdjX (TVP38/TMEM64 family) [Actinophytocola xinjiangensis]RPE89517.1 putative membrane protein YdjX (TVP38/TMEM64 family) [Salisediminibacterium halotolerans]TWG36276.1 putative membrane protein YdjX (TVP38/TMEM64 family) [Salisediminibacterium halotolerans]GEL07376.1 TVP38/TMEM64 family membrane protein YtxB [Salisediminibacterium halotolerans]
MTKKTILKLTAVVIVIGLLTWVNQRYLNIRPGEIRAWILSFGVYAPVIYLVLYAARPLILFPASIMTLGGGLAFGPFWGTVLSVAGASGSAAVAFFVARKLGKNVAAKDWQGRAEKIQQQLETNGFYYVFLLRFIPLLNFDLISYLAGVSKVKFAPFIFGTASGMIPGTFAYVFLGSSLVDPSVEVLILAGALFVLISVIPFLLSKKMKQRLGFK